VGEITELRGKVRADLRNEQLRRLLKAWEERRDELYDEISYRKGQVELLEEHIKFVYQSILDVNKEEGDRERARLSAKVEEIQKADAEEAIAQGAKKEKTKKPRKKQTPRKKVTKKK